MIPETENPQEAKLVYPDSLTCQVCRQSKTLEQCPEITHCSPDEECFVDEIINANGIFFNAGCRSKEVCNVRNSLPLGKRDIPTLPRNPDKRDAGDLVACSRCCDHDVNLTQAVKPCNTRLCGLPSNAGSNHLTCYECDHVTDFEHECNGVVSCGSDQVCGTQTQSSVSGDSHTYTFGCFTKRNCIALTKGLLRIHDQYDKLNQTVPGKRSEVHMCNVCCGGSYCNTGDCVKLENKLHELAKYGNLNLDTLEYV